MTGGWLAGWRDKPLVCATPSSSAWSSKPRRPPAAETGSSYGHTGSGVSDITHQQPFTKQIKKKKELQLKKWMDCIKLTFKIQKKKKKSKTKFWMNHTQKSIFKMLMNNNNTQICFNFPRSVFNTHKNTFAPTPMMSLVVEQTLGRCWQTCQTSGTLKNIDIYI